MNKKVLIIGLVWPEPTSSAAGTRMLQLVRFFIARNYDVTFASAAQKGEFSYPLKSLGVETVDILLNNTAFDAFVADLRPEIVMFDRYMTEEQFGWRAADAVPDAVRILDTEDLHCLRSAREQATKKDVPFATDSLLSSEVALREIASIHRCDLTLMIGTAEIELLRNLFSVRKELLHYVPFLYDPIEETELAAWPGFDARTDYLFIGNFHHFPNIDAVHYLKSEIWPRIRNLKHDAVIRIYGAYMPERVLQLHEPKIGFRIEGRAGSVQEVMRSARVFVAPLRIGAGQKGKLAEAMVHGLPCVTTSTGAESMSDGNWNGFISDDPDDVAEKAVELYADQQLWTQKQRVGFDMFNGLFRKQEAEDELERRLASLAAHLDGHRRQNFTGRMLMHHTTASYRNLSRWIEEKNRKC